MKGFSQVGEGFMISSKGFTEKDIETATFYDIC